MNFQIVTLLLRHLCGFIASYFVTTGFLQQSDADKFIGAVLFLATLAWSYINKRFLLEEEK